MFLKRFLRFFISTFLSLPTPKVDICGKKASWLKEVTPLKNVVNKWQNWGQTQDLSLPPTPLYYAAW